MRIVFFYLSSLLATAAVIISKPPGPERVAGEWYYDEPDTTLGGEPTDQTPGHCEARASRTRAQPRAPRLPMFVRVAQTCTCRRWGPLASET